MDSVQIDHLQMEFCSIILKAKGLLVSQFITWLDVKVAEYKVYGHMILTDDAVARHVQQLPYPSSEPADWPTDNQHDGTDYTTYQPNPDFGNEQVNEEHGEQYVNNGASVAEQDFENTGDEVKTEVPQVLAVTKRLKSHPFKSPLAQIRAKQARKVVSNSVKQIGKLRKKSSGTGNSLALPYTITSSSQETQGDSNTNETRIKIETDNTQETSQHSYDSYIEYSGEDNSNVLHHAQLTSTPHQAPPQKRRKSSNVQHIPSFNQGNSSLVSSPAATGSTVGELLDSHTIVTETGHKPDKMRGDNELLLLGLKYCSKAMREEDSGSDGNDDNQETPTLVCSIEGCLKTFKTKSGKDRHERTHTGNYPNICVECGKGFHAKSDLEEHQKVIHQGQYFQCPKCPVRVRTQHGIRLHQQLHTSERKTCDICSKTFKCSMYLQRHMQYHFPKYGCQRCGKRFAFQNLLQKHSLLHTDFTLKCKICNFESKHEYSLKRHMELHSDTPTKHGCTKCGKCFQRKDHLKKHLSQCTGFRENFPGWKLVKPGEECTESKDIDSDIDACMENKDKKFNIFCTKSKDIKSNDTCVESKELKSNDR